MAGRFTPSSLRRRIIEIAISAPVLPQDTATEASPARTASIVDHMEVSLPLRITWDGLASIVTTPLACRISQISANPRFLAIRRSSSGPSPCTMKRNCGLSAAAFDRPETTAPGPRSPPIASMDKTVSSTAASVNAAPSLMYSGPPQVRRQLGRVFVKIDFVLYDNITLVVHAAGRADVMRALQLAAGRAFVGVCCSQCIMCATHTALGARDLTLGDSHVTTSGLGPRRPPLGLASLV
mmetsp:Transcript_3496/g.6237  ORF Transcript_3496/g.6237 Transcript_3496/m.6237 type:complete len:238 (+) Transcript_3496:458-1171(+)